MRTPYFAFHDVSKTFGTNQVLNRVSFAAMPGETVCILGRSGTGKTVCLRLLMGFLEPDEGEVITATENITNSSEKKLEAIHRKVTIVFQEGALFDSLTVAENVAFPLRERDRSSEDEVQPVVAELLRLVNAEHLANRYPSEISTGSKRIVAIARALASKPEAILYDEPTTNADPLMARRITRLLNWLKERRQLTSIVVTHDMRLVEAIADRIVFLDRAKVIFEGTREQMERSQVPLVQEFLRLDLVDFRSLARVAPPSLRTAK
jgi:phospholipid/cholesterol/gamma-HCH transport system ATP-binding protein